MAKDVAKERYLILFALLQRCLVELDCAKQAAGKAVLPGNHWGCQDESGHRQNGCRLLHRHSWMKHLLN